MEWMRANKLKRNSLKMEVLVVGVRFDPILDGVILPLKEQVLRFRSVAEPGPPVG